MSTLIWSIMNHEYIDSCCNDTMVQLDVRRRHCKTHPSTSGNQQQLVIVLTQDAFTSHGPIHAHWHMLLLHNLFNHSLCMAMFVLVRDAQTQPAHCTDCASPSITVCAGQQLHHSAVLTIDRSDVCLTATLELWKHWLITFMKSMILTHFLQHVQLRLFWSNFSWKLAVDGTMVRTSYAMHAKCATHLLMQ